MGKLLIVALATISLMGCGRGASKNPFRAIAKGSEARELKGTFESACLGNKAEAVASGLMAGSWGEAIKAQRVQLDFQGPVGNSVVRKELHYAGADCSGDAYQFEEAGSFDPGPKPGDASQLRPIDFKFKSVKVTMHSQAAVDAANKAALCGRTNWSKDSRSVDVTDHANDKLCYHAGYDNGVRRVANAYRVSGDELHLGDTSKASVSISERPATASRQVFTRKVK